MREEAEICVENVLAGSLESVEHYCSQSVSEVQERSGRTRYLI